MMGRNLDFFKNQRPGDPLHDGPLHDIKGLTYIRNYLAPEVRVRILDQIDDDGSWLEVLKRRVQHHGFTYDYRTRKVDRKMRLGPLPVWSQEIAERLTKEGYFKEIPDQTIVNEYLPGQGISPHIDCEPCFTDTVASISLNSDAVLKLTNKSTQAVVDILLEDGSLVVLQGEARYKWQHSIPPRKKDTVDQQTTTRSRRVSLTFRKVIIEESPNQDPADYGKHVDRSGGDLA